MNYEQIIAAWNAQADEFNQWDELCDEEKIEWARKCALEEAASSIYPIKPEDEDWTTYSQCRADCAQFIRALKEKA